MTCATPPRRVYSACLERHAVNLRCSRGPRASPPDSTRRPILPRTSRDERCPPNESVHPAARRHLVGGRAQRTRSRDRASRSRTPACEAARKVCVRCVGSRAAGSVHAGPTGEEWGRGADGDRASCRVAQALGCSASLATRTTGCVAGLHRHARHRGVLCTNAATRWCHGLAGRGRDSTCEPRGIAGSALRRAASD